MGAARLAAADERNNRALADLEERLAAKDPGVRGIMKRSSVACHPESESQERVALDTEQDPTPQPRVSYVGSSASGVRPSAITIADRTGTSDVAQAGSGEHNDDVAMDGDGADDDSARHPNPSGSDGRRRKQSGTTEQHVPRRLFGKTIRQELADWTGPVRKQ